MSMTTAHRRARNRERQRRDLEIERDYLVERGEVLLAETLEGRTSERDEEILACHDRLREIEAEIANPNHVVGRQVISDLILAQQSLEERRRTAGRDDPVVQALRARLANLQRQHSRIRIRGIAA